MSQFLGMNKDRLYLAFYRRGRVKPDDAKYHTALLLVPKTVNDGTVLQRYHVKNQIIDGKTQWVFQDPEEVRPRTLRLVSVLYLGKVASKKKVRDAMKIVPIVQDDPAWRCRHWVWSAVQVCQIYFWQEFYGSSIYNLAFGRSKHRQPRARGPG
jgi:hypothetical protein